MTPTAPREAVEWFQERHAFIERRACELVAGCRSTVRYCRLVDPHEEQVVGRLMELAAERPRFGSRRLHVLLRREDLAINRKRVYRLYTAMELAVRRKKRKRVAAGEPHATGRS